jgi:hypothetical protein
MNTDHTPATQESKTRAVFELTEMELYQLVCMDHSLDYALGEARTYALPNDDFEGDADDYRVWMLWHDEAQARLQEVQSKRKAWLEKAQVTAEVAELARTLNYNPHNKPLPLFSDLFLDEEDTDPEERTVFDLSGSELFELKMLEKSLDYALKEARTNGLPGEGYEGDMDDYSIRSRWHDVAEAQLQAARDNLKAWLEKAQVTQEVAQQARETYYDPYKHADFIGLVAPPMPEGYESIVDLEARIRNAQWAAENDWMKEQLNQIAEVMYRDAQGR